MAALAQGSASAEATMDTRFCRGTNSIYSAEGCGICEQNKPPVNMFWYSRKSRDAHKTCCDKLKACEEKVNQVIDTLFGSKYQAYAHVEVVGDVKFKCGGLSLLQYYEQKGEAALKNLFNTVGIRAAMQERFAFSGNEKYGVSPEQDLLSIQRLTQILGINLDDTEPKPALKEDSIWSQYSTLASAYDSAGKLEESAKLFSIMLTNCPDKSDSTYLLYATVLKKLKKFEAAKAMLTAGLKAFPQTIYLEGQLGEILYLNKDYKEAVDYLLVWCFEHPGAHTLSMLGDALAHLKYYNGAKAISKVALTNDQNNALAKEVLKRLSPMALSEDDDKTVAVQHGEIGARYYQSGDYPQAFDYLMSACTKVPAEQNPKQQEMLADVMHRLGFFGAQMACRQQIEKKLLATQARKAWL